MKIQKIIRKTKTILPLKMKTLQVRHQSEIPAEPAALFAFHADPRNARHILPPTTVAFRVREGGPAAPGGTFHITCRELGVIPMSWCGHWAEVEFPRLLVDVAEQSPFAFWRHRHEFVQAGAGRSMLIDTVEVRWGKGWPGWLVTVTALRLYLTVFFLWRHRRTQRWFAKAK